MKTKNFPGKKYQRQLVAKYDPLAPLDLLFQQHLQVELSNKTKKQRNPT